MNLSLARIMYGTNEDLHAQVAQNAPAVLAISPRHAVEILPVATAIQAEGLRGLLHRAWKNLSGKL